MSQFDRIVAGREPACSDCALGTPAYNPQGPKTSFIDSATVPVATTERVPRTFTLVDSVQELNTLCLRYQPFLVIVHVLSYPATTIRIFKGR